MLGSSSDTAVIIGGVLAIVTVIGVVFLVALFIVVKACHGDTKIRKQDKDQ